MNGRKKWFGADSDEQAVLLKTTMINEEVIKLREKVTQEKHQELKLALNQLLDEIDKIQQSNKDNYTLSQKIHDILYAVEEALDYKNSSLANDDGMYQKAKLFDKLSEEVVKAQHPRKHKLAESLKKVGNSFLALSGVMLISSLVVGCIPVAHAAALPMVCVTGGIAVLGGFIRLAGEYIHSSVPKTSTLSNSLSIFSTKLTASHPNAQRRLAEHKRQQEETERDIARAAIMATMH